MSACEIDRFTCTLSACVLCVRCSSRVATDSRDLDKHTHTHFCVSFVRERRNKYVALQWFMWGLYNLLILYPKRNIFEFNFAACSNAQL